jgi:hypothetical protein
VYATFIDPSVEMEYIEVEDDDSEDIVVAAPEVIVDTYVLSNPPLLG